MNQLDAACLVHDLHTEARGPNRAGNDPVKILAADAQLEEAARAIARTNDGKIRLEALIVVAAMQANRLRASRQPGQPGSGAKTT